MLFSYFIFTKWPKRELSGSTGDNLYWKLFLRASTCSSSTSGRLLYIHLGWDFGDKLKFELSRTIFNGRKKCDCHKMVVMVHGKHKYAAWNEHVTVLIFATVKEFCIPQTSLLWLECFGARYTNFCSPSENTIVWKVGNIWISVMGSGGLNWSFGDDTKVWTVLKWLKMGSTG